MKTIAVLIAFLIMCLPSVAFPSDNPETNPDICKMAIDSGTSMTIIYAWQDPVTGIWEVKLGYGNYKGQVMVPITFAGGALGNVDIDLSDIRAT